MMCLKKQDLYIKFKGRVQAASAHVKSPWVESRYLEYIFDGKEYLLLLQKTNPWFPVPMSGG